MKDELNTIFETAFINAPNALAIFTEQRNGAVLNQAACNLLSLQEKSPIEWRALFPEITISDFFLGKTVITHCPAIDAQIELTLLAQDSACQVFSLASSEDKNRNFHNQRMETLGMLAGGIAHDFNNVLTGLLGHITYLKTILPNDGSHVESLLAIEEGSLKASTLTQQILNFSKLKTKDEIAPVDLNELLRKTCALLRGALPPAYRLELQNCETPLLVDGVEGKLAQVFVNLVMNAKAALGSSGCISVTLSESSVESKVAGLYERMAHVVILDDGEGIAPQILERMFEPYFSTKTHGTGLGLATVQKIIEESGGAVRVDSTVGKGTTVTVALPLSEHGEVLELPEETPQLPSGTERILVVDDEGPVRNVLCLSLRHLGYEVVVAQSGNEAIHLFKEHEGHFDLIVLDMLMPQLSGDETFFLLKEMQPDIRVLIISGFSSEEAVQKILDNGGKGFVQKPFTIEQLSVAVRRSLES